MAGPLDRSTATRLAFATALGLLAAHVAAKATRDALFLSTFPVTLLPRIMVASALLALVGAGVMGRLLARSSPASVVPRALLFSSALFVVEWALLGIAPAVGSVAVYLHIAALGVVLLSGFWSVVNERFDPYTGKAVVARIGGFAALGGVVGGLGARSIASEVGAAGLLLLLAGVHAACAFSLRGVGAGAPPEKAAPADAVSGLRVIAKSPFLLRMAALVALLAVGEALLDYALKVEATRRFRDEASLIRFFGVFYTAVGAASFLLQASLGPRVLRVLGLGGAMALLPALTAMAAGFGALVSRLWTAALARGASAALTGSFFRSAFELLYTPLPTETKRPSKAWVDVGGQRSGDILGGGTILALLFVAPDLPPAAFLALAVGVFAGTLLLVLRLHRAYVRQLAESLRSGAFALEESQAVDATTVRALADSRVTIDREEVLARIRELRGARERADGEPAEAAERPGARHLGPFIERVEGLASDDPERVRRTLEEALDDARLLPHVLPLLGRFDVLEAAVGFLRHHAERHVGQLADALVDGSLPNLVRRRLPWVLEAGRGPRVLDALRLGLADSDFEVRLESARAGVRLVARDAVPRLGKPEAFALAERELSVDRRVWDHQGVRRLDGGKECVLLDGPPPPGLDRSVEHVFTLLALALRPDMMGCTLRAAYAGDEKLHGTALEYLEAMLPDDLCRALVAKLPRLGGGRRPRRPAEQIADELLRTTTALRAAPQRSR